jgi:hypothetical protein
VRAGEERGICGVKEQDVDLEGWLIRWERAVSYGYEVLGLIFISAKLSFTLGFEG